MKQAAHDNIKKTSTTTTAEPVPVTTTAVAIEDNDKYVLTLSRSLIEPFLTFSSRRDLREKGNW